MSMNPSKLEKVKITAYKSGEFVHRMEKPFSFLINPESYSQDFGIDYPENPGEAVNKSKFRTVPLEKVSFTVIMDATDTVSSSGLDLTAQLNKLNNVLYSYDGDIHRSNFFELSYGTFLFKCQLISMLKKYTLFNNEGTPLKAELNLTFKEWPDARPQG